jgi:hypothetical protein
MSNGGQPSIPGMGHPVIPKPVPPAIPKVPPPLPKPPPPVVAKPPPPRIAKPEVPLGTEALSPGPGGRTTVMAKAKKLTHWEVIFRIGVVLVMLASIAFPWWTYSERLIPLQKESRDLTSSNSALSAEVDKMDRKWSKDDAEFIRAKYKEVYSSLFADEAALQEWLDRLQKRALPLSLDVKVDFGKGTPQMSDERLAIIPASVTLQVHPMPNAKDSPFQRLLRLGQQLGTEGKRADLAELTVIGGTGSITNAILVFNLWAGEQKVQASK